VLQRAFNGRKTRLAKRLKSIDKKIGVAQKSLNATLSTIKSCKISADEDRRIKSSRCQFCISRSVPGLFWLITAWRQKKFFYSISNELYFSNWYVFFLIIRVPWYPRVSLARVSVTIFSSNFYHPPFSPVFSNTEEEGSRCSCSETICVNKVIWIGESASRLKLGNVFPPSFSPS
jgi:hypothetical protein